MPPEHLALKASRASAQELHRTEGKRLHSWRVHTSFHMHWDPGQSSNSIGVWVRTTCKSWGYPGEVGVGCSSLWGQGHWGQRPQGIFMGVSSPGGHHFGTETWSLPTTFRLLCWDASGQTNNSVAKQPHHQQTGCLKSSWGHSLLNHNLDMDLPTIGTRPRSTHMWVGTNPFHQEACTSLWTNLTH